MFLGKSRTRIVSIRLSEEEYREVILACSASGKPRFSEYARTAIVEYARAAGRTDESLLRQLAAVDRRLSDLISRLGNIEAAVQLTKGTSVSAEEVCDASSCGGA